MATGASFAARITAANLRVDAVTAEVLRAFETAGVQSILLKGPSLTRWLSTSEHPRPYLDCDLLVSPSGLNAAERALAGLGFEPTVDEGDMPEWWREHASTWTRAEDDATVDLHRSLPGIGAPPEEGWRALSAEVEPFVVGGYGTQALTIPGRAFLLALHAAQHGADWSRPLTDLERALSAADDASWREAAELAATLEATAAFGTGLRLVPPGRLLADRLGLPTGQTTEVVLRAGTAPPVALGLDQLAKAEGHRARLAILWHKLVPPATFMRHWSPLARRGRLGLALAYLWRPLWLLARLPAGFRAWRDARCESRRSGSSRAGQRP